jgi:hypothetical protein
MGLKGNLSNGYQDFCQSIYAPGGLSLDPAGDFRGPARLLVLPVDGFLFAETIQGQLHDEFGEPGIAVFAGTETDLLNSLRFDLVKGPRPAISDDHF